VPQTDIQNENSGTLRLTPDDIKRESYWAPDDSQMVICVLTLKNGINSVGVGCEETAAREDACNKLYDFARKAMMNSARNPAGMH
jgi:hypothetical protein